jgi:hypothetical protein
MINLAAKMAQALALKEKLLVFIPDLDPGIFHTFINGPIPPYGVAIASERDDLIGKYLSTKYKDIYVPVIDSRSLNPSGFDHFFIPSHRNAARYTLNLIVDHGINPLRIHLAKGLFSYEHNNIFKTDNHWATISKTIQIEGGLVSDTLLAQVYDCMKYIAHNNIDGDIVNLGVYKGWSMKYMLLLLDHFNLQHKSVIGFDTFDGFIISDKKDVFSNSSPDHAIESDNYKGIRPDDVSKSLQPFTNFQLVKGDISVTLKDISFPKGICLALFDMDDYTPTATSLPIIYSNTNKGGFFVNDHYTMSSCNEALSCIGQRIAVDEFVADHVMLNLSGTNIFMKP